jgi:hypothetical protein
MQLDGSPRSPQIPHLRAFLRLQLPWVIRVYTPPGKISVSWLAGCASSSAMATVTVSPQFLLIQPLICFAPGQSGLLQTVGGNHGNLATACLELGHCALLDDEPPLLATHAGQVTPVSAL